MRSYKVMLALFVLLSLSTTGLLFFLNNPMEAKYLQVVDERLEEEGLKYESELLELYPELQVARKNMDRVKRLRLEIERICGGPAPVMTTMDSEAVRKKWEEIARLNHANDRILSELERLAASKSTPAGIP